MRLISVVCVLALSGCAVDTLPPDLARIRPMSQNSPLLAKCQDLGPVTGGGWPAYRKILSEVKDKGGDTIVYLRNGSDSQGLAFRCY